MEKADNGFYLFYAKDGELYQVLLKPEEWDVLQIIPNTIIQGNIKVLDDSFGQIYKKEILVRGVRYVLK